MAVRNIPNVEDAIVTENVDYRGAEELRGNVWESTNVFTGVEAGSVAEVLIEPSSVPTRLAVSTCKGGVSSLSAQAFENPTVSEGDEGTALASYNHRRDSTKTPNTTFYKGPIVGGTGSALPAYDLDPLGGWILEADTQYLIRITNDSASSGEIHYKAAWNEPV